MIDESDIAAAREAEKRARLRAQAAARDPAMKTAVRQANAKMREMSRERLPKKA
jgi:hypothetical protein